MEAQAEFSHRRPHGRWAVAAVLVEVVVQRNVAVFRDEVGRGKGLSRCSEASYNVPLLHKRLLSAAAWHVPCELMTSPLPPAAVCHCHIHNCPESRLGWLLHRSAAKCAASLAQLCAQLLHIHAPQTHPRCLVVPPLRPHFPECRLGNLGS